MRMSLANAIVSYLEQIKGVRDIERNDLSEKKQVRAVIDHQSLARLGLNATDIALNLRTAYTGEIVTKVRYEDEEVDFRVSCKSKAIENLDTVRNLLIPNARGDLIKLGTVVEFIMTKGTPEFSYYHDYCCCRHLLFINSSFQIVSPTILGNQCNPIQHSRSNHCLSTTWNTSQFHWYVGSNWAGRCGCQ